MKFHFDLEKRSQRRLDPTVVREQINYVVRRALAGGRGKVWGLARTPTVKSDPASDGYLYTTRVTLSRTGRSAPEATLAKQWGVIRSMAEGAARGKGWVLLGELGESKAASKTVEEPTPKAPISKAYAPVSLSETDNGAGHFSHLYGRDAQIEIVRSAIRAATESNMEERFHCVLYGQPASGKTEILRSFARWIGSDSVLSFDATSTTAAGAIEVLKEAESIPPILIIEEIEKTDEQSLRWLLGVLDQRGEIRKTTYRGTIQRSVKLLCLATVNDMGLFGRMMDGALASRFSHKIYCPRPDRAILHRILDREVARHGGKREWIRPALDWCLDEERTTDPRRATAVCMSGRDALLTGAYQTCLRQTLPPVVAE